MRWQQGELEDRDEERERSAGGGVRGVSSVSETLCHGLDEEMKCAASIRRWAKIKASPTLSHMVLFDQCFAFSLSAFFSASRSLFSSFLRAGLLFFSPVRNSSTLLRQQRGSTQGERSKKTKPAADSLFHTRHFLHSLLSFSFLALFVASYALLQYIFIGSRLKCVRS